MEQSLTNIDQVRAEIYSVFDNEVRMRAIITAAEYTEKAFSDIYAELMNHTSASIVSDAKASPVSRYDTFTYIDLTYWELVYYCTSDHIHLLDFDELSHTRKHFSRAFCLFAISYEIHHYEMVINCARAAFLRTYSCRIMHFLGIFCLFAES
ncbi:uncharacterized protein Bfra_011441 [Botrytis fragariae]|uniref:Uncharacterized protein n=1 Tax=Botrytis fragariae TaxID=1964551 RepID=A0A8H6AXQ6_9HELO|nr:uncharacterized protein Bfra_011441 [Botrytis fragariae]KAF5875679.1 hypothetical protein Bfra_011441 [Botrytis fragariae]